MPKFPRGKEKKINFILFYRYKSISFLFFVLCFVAIQREMPSRTVYNTAISPQQKYYIAPAHSQNPVRGYDVRNNNNNNRTRSPLSPFYSINFFWRSTLIISSMLLLSRRCFVFLFFDPCLLSLQSFDGIFFFRFQETNYIKQESRRFLFSDIQTLLLYKIELSLDLSDNIKCTCFITSLIISTSFFLPIV